MRDGWEQVSSAIGRTVITICKLEVKKLTDDVFKSTDLWNFLEFFFKKREKVIDFFNNYYIYIYISFKIT